MTEVGLCNFDVGSLLNKCDAEVERAVNRFKEGRSVTPDLETKVNRYAIPISGHDLWPVTLAGARFFEVTVILIDAQKGLPPHKRIRSLEYDMRELPVDINGQAVVFFDWPGEWQKGNRCGVNIRSYNTEGEVVGSVLFSAKACPVKQKVE